LTEFYEIFDKRQTETARSTADFVKSATSLVEVAAGVLKTTNPAQGRVYKVGN
jgi:hypothetical protein